MIAACDHSSQLPGGGLTEAQALKMLGQIQPGRTLHLALAGALCAACFHPATAVEKVEEIRREADRRAALPLLNGTGRFRPRR